MEKFFNEMLNKSREQLIENERYISKGKNFYPKLKKKHLEEITKSLLS